MLSTFEWHVLSGVCVSSVLLVLLVKLKVRSACHGNPDKSRGEDRRRTMKAHIARVKGTNDNEGYVLKTKKSATSPKAGRYVPAENSGADPKDGLELLSWRDDPSVVVTDSYVTAADGAQLYVQRWMPGTTQPKAMIFACHGYADQVNWMFQPQLHYLCSLGYGVIAADIRGHGQSDGLHIYIPDFEQLVDDAECILAPLRQEFEGMKWFMYGESMGGALAIKLGLRNQEAWSGAILSAPMCKIADHMKPPQFVISALTKVSPFAPALPAVPTKDLLDNVFKKQVDRDRARSNPLGFPDKPRLATGLTLLNASTEIENNLSAVEFPFFVLHGADDVVTCPSVSQALYDQASSTDKRLELYEHCWHALSYEEEQYRDQIRADMKEWLDERAMA